MSNRNTVVALFDVHSAVEDAVRRLQRAGLDIKQLSILGKDYHTAEHVVGFVTTGANARFCGELGAFWGGLRSMLSGSAAIFVFPGLGYLMVLGPLASAILCGLENPVPAEDVSVLAYALVSLGVPRTSVIKYERALKAGKFALIAHGTEETGALARRILDASLAIGVDASGEMERVGGTGRPHPSIESSPRQPNGCNFPVARTEPHA